MATIHGNESGQRTVGDPQQEHREEPAIGVRSKMGRPRKLEPNDLTLGRIQTLAQLGCTVEEGAAYLGVDKKTFIKFKADYPQVREVWERGSALCRLSLRRRLIELAKTDGRAAILLAVNYLGMHRRCCPKLRKVPETPEREGVREFTLNVFDKSKRVVKKCVTDQPGEPK